MLFFGRDLIRTKRKHSWLLVGIFVPFFISVNLKGSVSLDEEEAQHAETISTDVKDQKDDETIGKDCQKEETQGFYRSQWLSGYGWMTESDIKDFCGLIRHTPVELDLEGLFEKCSYQKLLEWGMKLVEETQNKFWNRQNGKERWEVQPSSWMANDMQENFDRLNRLGFTRSVFPKRGIEDSLKGPAKEIVCVLGATKGRMRERLQFLADLIESGDIKPHKIVLLSGERFVIPGKDGSQEELEQLAQELAQKKGIKSLPLEAITEMDVLQDLCEKEFEKPFKGLEIVPIDVEATIENGKTRRPTTQSTVQKFISWLDENPEYNQVFFVSNQPYVLYQDAVIRTVFLACGKTDICVQTLGNQISSSREDLSLNSMQPLYEAFASYLWAKLLWILDSLTKEGFRPEFVDGFVERLEALYKDSASRVVLSSLQKCKD